MTAPYLVAQQEAALKAPHGDIDETVLAVQRGIDKALAENNQLRTALKKVCDAYDAYFDDMGISPDDTPLSREVAEARKAL